MNFPRVPVLAALALLLGCGDSFDPVVLPVPETPEEETLADFVAGDPQDPPAFDLITAIPVRVDLSPAWDFLFAIGQDGSPELRPRGMVTGVDSDAGLQPASAAFEAIEEAPQEGYERRSAVLVAEGDVLFAVSRRDPSFVSLRCRRFAKLEILGIDLEARTLTFRHLINPNCERRTLVPGAQE